MADRPDVAKLSLPGISVAHCLLPAWEAGDYVSHSAPSSVGVSFTAQDCVIDIGGKATGRGVARGDIVLTSTDAPAWLRVDRPSDLIEVSADRSIRASVAEEFQVAASADLADLVLEHDPIAWAVAARLRALTRAPQSNAIEVEMLVRRFFARAFELKFGGRLKAKGDGGLDTRRVARVIEYIDANSDERLGLAELADIAALSPFHFHRSFRRTFGCTPHQYVAMRRTGLSR